MISSLETTAAMPLSGLVIAGGRSSRMGTDKALLIVEGQTLVQRVVSALRTLCDEVIVVTNSPDTAAATDAPTVRDLIPQQGPLSGIHAGLSTMRNEHGFFVACDMPWLNLEFIKYLVGLVDGFDVIVPRLDGRCETLHAVYGKPCLAPIEAALREQRRRVTAFYEAVRVRYVERDECERFDRALQMFANVNTPEEFEQQCSTATSTT